MSRALSHHFPLSRFPNESKTNSHAMREEVSVSVKVGERGLDLVDLFFECWERKREGRG